MDKTVCFTAHHCPFISQIHHSHNACTLQGRACPTAHASLCLLLSSYHHNHGNIPTRCLSPLLPSFHCTRATRAAACHAPHQTARAHCHAHGGCGCALSHCHVCLVRPADGRVLQCCSADMSVLPIKQCCVCISYGDDWPSLGHIPAVPLACCDAHSATGHSCQD